MNPARSRLDLISQCSDEIARAAREIKAGNHDMGGPWLGYMDWLEELHYMLHEKTPEERKHYPLCTGLLDYFPDALVAVAHVSHVGNEQHNPGEPLRWAREKSTNHEDTMLRHWMQRKEKDTDGTYHAAKAVWRALAYLQLLIEAERAPR